MLIHPNFDPVAIAIGPIAVRWYGLMYLAAFGFLWWLGHKRIAQGLAPVTREQFDDLIFYGVVGTILGGRLGYVLFYKPGCYFSHPLEIFAIWQGGMAFHGGFLGVLAAAAFYAWRHRIDWWRLMDFVAPCVPTGLAAGRLGNFINGELWGRPTDLPWGMVFRAAGDLPRHPSQLYQFALEGVLLFALLWWYSSKPRARGAVSAMFLIGYGAFRFLAEFAREPDDFLGLLALGLSMGQWLSLPMIALGACGAISAVANITPREIASITDGALAGRWEEARRAHFELLPLMRACFLESNPIPIKAALAMLGLCRDELRLPLLPMTPAPRAQLRAALSAFGFEIGEKAA